jgi:histidine phosphotransferase ChpT
MSGNQVLSDLDLAALLCSRVCHDVISPVGAIANGLEVLEDEDDEDMRRTAMDLVQRSARQASAKLQFCRIAFGAAGSAGATIDLGEAGDTAKAFVGEEKVKLDWQAPRITLPKGEVKLLLNMMLLGIGAVPRGGTVSVALEGGAPVVRATGDAARVPEKAAQVLTGQFDAQELDARLVQPYYTRRLAEESGFEVRFEAEGNKITLRAHKIDQSEGAKKMAGSSPAMSL